MSEQGSQSGRAVRPAVAVWARWIGLILLLGLVGGMSLYRAYRNKFDFHHFYLDARYVWQHGELNPDLDNPDRLQRRQLPFYLPVVSLLLAPVTFAGQKTAAVLWAAGQVACLGVALRVLAGWCRTGPRIRAPDVVLTIACLLSFQALWEAAKFNQLTFPVLALLAAAFSGLEKGRPLRAGTLLGLAAIVKLLPVIFVVWLLLKRQWKALGAFVATAALVTFVPSLAIFGPQKTLQYHRQWLDHNVHGAPARGMADGNLDDHFIDRRNQGLTVVCARLFSPEHPKRVSYQPMQLSADTCLWLSHSILVLLLGGLLWNTLRPWRELGQSQRRAEFAAYLLGMMVFSPLMRQYYLVWALPAVALFLCSLADRATGRRRIVGWMGSGLWLLGMLLWTWRPARVCGLNWLMLVVMGVLLLVANARGSGPREKHEVTFCAARQP